MQKDRGASSVMPGMIELELGWRSHARELSDAIVGHLKLQNNAMVLSHVERDNSFCKADLETSSIDKSKRMEAQAVTLEGCLLPVKPAKAIKIIPSGISRNEDTKKGPTLGKTSF
ncbi:hypothetical protein NE237_015784 [Protea cynaroides]|uniref:Uncharacterized protein n=1 Tax=Protea cynaroides TaxID=273540 RepID=A0A9Q0KEG7_9MAGN|nr:hypothetical protein NE237_015784 [Protea cynaroides]